MSFTRITNKDLLLSTDYALGETENGRVRKATWENRPVAVKFFDFPKNNQKKTKEARKAFKEELANHSYLLPDQHPNLVQLLGQGETSGHSFLVFDLATDSLDFYIRKQETPSFSFILQMMQQISAGLSFMHGKNLLHCDLKPGNILLYKKDPLELKIADLSLSVLAVNASAPGRGSELWSAPELLNEEKNTQATDVYAMSVIFCELVAWQEAYFLYPMREREFARKVIEENLRPQIPPTREIKLNQYPEVKDLITFGLSKKPEERPSADAIQTQVSLSM